MQFRVIWGNFGQFRGKFLVVFELEWAARQSCFDPPSQNFVKNGPKNGPHVTGVAKTVSIYTKICTPFTQKNTPTGESRGSGFKEN